MTNPEFPPEPPQPEFPQEARKVFSESLDDLRIDVIRLGALTTEAIAGATQALLDADLSEAEAVIERDDAIDGLYHSIEDRCLLVLARQQPMATDLRTIVTIMRINHELERSADLMVNVAEDHPPPLPAPPRPQGPGDHRPDGRPGVEPDPRRHRRVRRRRSVTGGGAPRHGRRDGRARQEPLPPHPRAGAPTPRPRSRRRCRSRWSAATTSGSPTTP